MTKAILYRTLSVTLICLFAAINSVAQFAFTNSNNLLSSASQASLRSGCAVTVVDVNNDGLDDILRMDQSINLHLELQQQDGTFTHTDLGNITFSQVWAMAAADVDHNGWKDIVTGNYGELYLVKLFYSGGLVTATTTQLAGSYFVQNITFGDIDNDGWVDVFVCDDNDASKTYKNDGAGNLNLDATLINTTVNPGVFIAGDPADSGNYGSVWTDFDNDGDMDLFVAHCRQSASSSNDVRRKDRLFVNDGSNNYTEAGSLYGIEVTDFKQTWTASFGDIDNDGDLDLLETCHGESSIILENNGSGTFTDITSTTGFYTYFDPIESILEDFDNDGYLDVLITGNHWELWRNNGNKTFTQVYGALADLGGMLSFATGDLNHDGAIDLYASYGSIYNNPSSSDDDVLYLNDKNNNNHFITFNLTGVVSNEGAIGAHATIYGAFGKQVREIRSGETYGTSNSFQLHFGLGINTTIDSARIDWPAGGVSHFNTLNADQFVTVVENGCSIVDNTIPGTHIICGVQTITLNAPSGYSAYQWSSMETTPSISVSTVGTFNVLVTSSNGCTNISPTVKVELNPDESPEINVIGELTSCQGGLTLLSTPAATYTWTGPGGFTASTQSISPIQSGTYSLSVQGQCGVFSGTPVAVTILPSPSPTVTGASGPGPASFNLSAAGTGTLFWYDQLAGGTLLTTGTTYTTPIISNNTTYYVQNAVVISGAANDLGPKYFDGTAYFSSSNGSVIFDVLANCTLNSVKVYTDTPGNREIQLQNSFGTVINSLVLNLIADTTIIALNWDLFPGINYELTTNSSVNTATLGNISPRLLRSNLGVNYPYSLIGLVTLTGSNQGSSVYYYFYDWEIQEPSTTCISERVPVTATITSAAGINDLNQPSGYKIYPNPAAEIVNLVFESNISSTIIVSLTDLTGRTVKSWQFKNAVQGQAFPLDIENVSSGSYLMNIKADTNNWIQKLIVNY
ncbi:MAG: FG-GAP-like repeat-containing protein [Bacteroidota bacterium]